MALGRQALFEEEDEEEPCPIPTNTKLISKNKKAPKLPKRNKDKRRKEGKEEQESAIQSDNTFFDIIERRQSRLSAQMERLAVSQAHAENFPVDSKIRVDRNFTKFEEFKDNPFFMEQNIGGWVSDAKVGKLAGKGLRKLAERAFQIMMEQRRATYKEVANTLMAEMQQQGKRPQRQQEESNIKRRVYDALNVLIAMKVLRKDNKMISFDQNVKDTISHFRTKQKELSETCLAMKQKQEAVARKNELVRQLRIKECKLLRFFEKRKAEKQRESQRRNLQVPDPSSEMWAEQGEGEPRIYFFDSPLLAISIPGFSPSMLQLDRKRQRLLIKKDPRECTMLGHLDILPSRLKTYE